MKTLRRCLNYWEIIKAREKHFVPYLSTWHQLQAALSARFGITDLSSNSCRPSFGLFLTSSFYFLFISAEASIRECRGMITSSSPSWNFNCPTLAPATCRGCACAHFFPSYFCSSLFIPCFKEISPPRLWFLPIFIIIFLFFFHSFVNLHV